MSINAGDALNEAFFRIQKLEAELAQVKAERKEWKTKFKDLDRALACELRDPCGTIWEHAKKLQDNNDALRAGYLDLLGQVEQAREGFGIYRDSPTMASAIATARSILGLQNGGAK